MSSPGEDARIMSSQAVHLQPVLPMPDLAVDLIARQQHRTSASTFNWPAAAERLSH